MKIPPAALKSYLEFCLLEPSPISHFWENINNPACVSITQLAVVEYGINAACEQRASESNHRFAAVQVEDVRLAQQTPWVFSMVHRLSFHVLCQHYCIRQPHHLHQLTLILFLRQNAPCCDAATHHQKQLCCRTLILKLIYDNITICFNNFQWKQLLFQWVILFSCISWQVLQDCLRNRKTSWLQLRGEAVLVGDFHWNQWSAQDGLPFSPPKPCPLALNLLIYIN